MILVWCVSVRLGKEEFGLIWASSIGCWWNWFGLYEIGVQFGLVWMSLVWYGWVQLDMKEFCWALSSSVWYRCFFLARWLWFGLVCFIPVLYGSVWCALAELGWCGWDWFGKYESGVVCFSLVCYVWVWFGMVKFGLIRMTFVSCSLVGWFGLFRLDVFYPHLVWFSLVWCGGVGFGIDEFCLVVPSMNLSRT